MLSGLKAWRNLSDSKVVKKQSKPAQEIENEIILAVLSRTGSRKADIPGMAFFNFEKFRI